ncbi:MAG: signal peptidase II [Clostridiales bacterium]|nr:signal peptidase II [Clostridiales bacterium]
MAILPIILFFAIVAVDQLTKIIVAAADIQFEIIGGLLSLEYTQNSGAAFGLFGSQSWGIALFSLISIGAIAVCFIVLTKTNSKLLSCGVMVLAAGTAGNLIDRLCTLLYQMIGDKYYGLDGFAGGVRDFLNIQFFANINIADIAITAGVVIICLYLLFLGPDPVFNLKKKKVEAPVEGEVEAQESDTQE